MTEYSMLDVGDRSSIEVLSPACFLGMGRARVWNVGDVLELVSRRLVVRVSGSVVAMDFPTARVGLGGGESVDLKLRLSREE